MSRARTMWILFLGLATFALTGIFFTANAGAQQRTTEQRQTGEAQVRVEVRNGTVAYIEGDYLVARLEDGRLEAFRVPEGFLFNIEGKQLTLQELTPGMELTQTIVSTTKPVVVKTVDIVDGTVWQASHNKLAIRDRNNKLVEYEIPEWAKIRINGQDRDLFELRHGQRITATIITEEPMTLVEQESKVHGRYPAKAAPKTEAPAQAPVETQAQPTTTEEEKPVTQTPAEELPATASELPLAGLLGLLAIAAAFGLRLVRRSV